MTPAQLADVTTAVSPETRSRVRGGGWGECDSSRACEAFKVKFDEQVFGSKYF